MKCVKIAVVKQKSSGLGNTCKNNCITPQIVSHLKLMKFCEKCEIMRKMRNYAEQARPSKWSTPTSTPFSQIQRRKRSRHTSPYPNFQPRYSDCTPHFRLYEVVSLHVCVLSCMCRKILGLLLKPMKLCEITIHIQYYYNQSLVIIGGRPWLTSTIPRCARWRMPRPWWPTQPWSRCTAPQPCWCPSKFSSAPVPV